LKIYNVIDVILGARDTVAKKKNVFGEVMTVYISVSGYLQSKCHTIDVLNIASCIICGWII
jgi:hypothetical protein